MRPLAYALLIAGFFWICFCQFEVGALTRGVYAAQVQKLPRQPSYTADDVHTAIHSAVSGMADSIPSFLIGGVLMFVGGAILDSAAKQKRVSTLP